MEASARKKKRPLAAIPENLEELSTSVLSNQIVAVTHCAQVEARAHQDHRVVAAPGPKEAAHGR